ncbi:YrrS family protein [Siminovitchia sp. 179-K 8D1 HS]|uniref:YrrS family protein n=1 Tax=Siminovitchia sp. 179-K 8D1 HS TaxID=3142385 RepID=UPI0039A0060E
MPVDFNQRSRSELRAKRRKTNIILNTLIAIVIILILIVGGRIFFGGDNPNEPDVAANPPDSKKIADQEKNDQTKKSLNEENEAPKESEEEPEEKIEKESDEPNVEKVIIDPNWEPVGTEQTNGHQPSYNKGTVDWNEKLKAVSHAVDIPEDNMILWWIEGGEDRQNQAIATVSARGSEDTYRVFIEWVDGEGWKPTEVKKLIQNDKKQ